jgi:hypothetical protein
MVVYRFTDSTIYCSLERASGTGLWQISNVFRDITEWPQATTVHQTFKIEKDNHDIFLHRYPFMWAPKCVRAIFARLMSRRLASSIQQNPGLNLFYQSIDQVSTGDLAHQRRRRSGGAESTNNLVRRPCRTHLLRNRAATETTSTLFLLILTLCGTTLANYLQHGHITNHVLLSLWVGFTYKLYIRLW